MAEMELTTARFSQHSTDEIDAMIEDANRLIESIQEICSTPPGDRLQSSPKSSSDTSVKNMGLSSPSSLEIELEIGRINRLCDSVEEDLRSFAHTPVRTRHSNSMHNFTDRSPVVALPARRRARRSAGITPQAYIELSDTSYTPGSNRNSNHALTDDGDDDDVVIISSDLDSIVDLCTPRRESRVTNRNRNRNNNENNLSIPLRRSNASRRHARASTNSRNQNRNNNSNSSSDGHSNSNLYRSRSPQSEPTISDDKSSVSTTTKQSITDSGVGRTPFMCAICMDSIVNNQPTSTKCGHVFCGPCIREAVRVLQKCPMCKKKQNRNSLFRIYI